MLDSINFESLFRIWRLIKVNSKYDSCGVFGYIKLCVKIIFFIVNVDVYKKSNISNNDIGILVQSQRREDYIRYSEGLLSSSVVHAFFNYSFCK